MAIKLLASNICSGFLILVSACFCHQVFAQDAATVIFRTGNPVVKHADGNEVALSKGDSINAGDTIMTHNGRLQFTTIDGGKVSLQPNTIFKIKRYEFSGKEDGTEYAITELIKGGLRTITGLIGHKNRDRYQLQTPVATIGIRGTEFSVFYDAKLIMTTNHGSVDVCNAGGCRNAVTGQSISAVSDKIKPQYTSEIANVVAAPTSAVKPVFIQTEVLNAQREPAVIVQLNSPVVTPPVVTPPVVTPPVVTPPVVTSPVVTSPTLTNTPNGTVNVKASDIMLTSVSVSPLTVTNFSLLDGVLGQNANNNLTAFENSDTSIKLIAANINDFYEDSFVTMGRTKGKINNVNIETASYITGEITSPGQLTALANLASPVNYNVIASTAPVSTSIIGSSIVVAPSNSVTGNMSINFASLNYNYGLSIPLSPILGTSTVYNLNGAGNLTAGSADFSNTATVSAVTQTSTLIYTNTSETATVFGRVIGDQAQRVGVQYVIPAVADTSKITGSVVMGKQ